MSVLFACFLDHILRDEDHHDGNAWHQKHEAADHIVSTVGKQREMDASTVWFLLFI